MNRALRTPLVAVVATVTVVTAALSTSACGSSSTDAGGSSGAPASVSLKIGQTGWAASQAALQVAGLDNTPYRIEWPVFSGGDQQLQALQSKALDVAQSSETPPIFVAAGGTVNFTQVAVQTASTLLQEVVVGKDSSITSIKDLKGKKVGYVKNTTAAYFLNELLKQNGLSWTDIESRPVSPNDGLAALQGGSIDAFASYGNTIIQAHAGGAKTIGSGENILSGNFPWSTTKALLGDAAKKAALADLLARLDRAYAYIRDGHLADYAKRFAAATKQPEASAVQQITQQEAQRPTHLGVVTPAAEQSQQRVADSFVDIKAIPAAVKVSDLWSTDLNSALQSALEKGGK
ncbi:ABC transporter substrate-binding protein [Tsukamurella sp. NPDC003166]|uniref:ABC transporter substrate-binding protein n=1 Tax=Tsukamurella sp. NPDC003166 TaxID=3154444 RepID=UPI00339E74CC